MLYGRLLLFKAVDAERRLRHPSGEQVYVVGDAIGGCEGVGG